MRCPQCQAENPVRGKFCLECRHQAAGGPARSVALPAPQSKFCFECGFDLGPPPRSAPSPLPPPSRPGTARR